MELKEELLANLIEKYNDHLMNGKTEEEAYTTVISGIGDISELIENMREPYPLAPYSPKERNKHALFVSLAVAIYIMSIFIVPIFTVNFSSPMTGIFIMLCCIAIATGLLIYSNMMRQSYIKSDDSLVEDFKAYRVKTDKRKAAYNSFKSAFWSIVVAIYLLISFLFGIWAYSWIIYIIAGAVEEIVKGIIQLGSEEYE